MDIRKIIKEEVDDFEWAKNVNHFSFEYLNNKSLHFDPPISDMDSLVNILGILADLGFNTFNQDNLVEDGTMEHVIGLYMNDGYVVWSGYSFESYQEHINDYAERVVEVIDGWGLFGGLMLESNDFDWAKDAGIPDIHVGAKFKVPVGTVYTINKIDGTMVHWFGKDIRDGELIISSDRIRNVQDRLDKGIWVSVD